MESVNIDAAEPEKGAKRVHYEFPFFYQTTKFYTCIYLFDTFTLFRVIFSHSLKKVDLNLLYLYIFVYVYIVYLYIF